MEKTKFSELAYYHDWIMFFEIIKQKEIDDELYKIAINGKLEDAKTSIVNFKKQLISCINDCLNIYFNRFAKSLNLLFVNNDTNQIIRISQKLKLTIMRLNFFNNLSFLDHDFIKELNESFLENIKSFYDELLKQLRKHSMENDNAFELYYILKKYRI